MKPREWHRDLDGLPNIGASHAEALRYRADKGRAYREGFDEFLKYSVPTEIAGQPWLVHPNVNLYIDATPACSGDCPFCIAKVTYSRKAIPRRAFMRRLGRALDAVAHLNPSVQVVGGEPTLLPTSHLSAIFAEIDARGMRRPVLGTNGTGLSKRTIAAINASTIEHVNISRHHFKGNRNMEVMRLRKPFGNSALHRAIDALRPPVRMQCNLIAGQIDSHERVMRFVDWARRIGVRSLAFAQLTPLPRGDIYRDPIIDYVEARQVDVDSILAEVDADPRFEFVKYRGGVACYYEVWRYLGDTSVLFKFSDNAYLAEADAEPRHVPDMVVHTDGALCGSWDRNTKVMVSP